MTYTPNRLSTTCWRYLNRIAAEFHPVWPETGFVSGPCCSPSLCRHWSTCWHPPWTNREGLQGGLGKRNIVTQDASNFCLFYDNLRNRSSNCTFLFLSGLFVGEPISINPQKAMKLQISPFSDWKTSWIFRFRRLLCPARAARCHTLRPPWSWRK